MSNRPALGGLALAVGLLVLAKNPLIGSLSTTPSDFFASTVDSRLSCARRASQSPIPPPST